MAGLTLCQRALTCGIPQCDGGLAGCRQDTLINREAEMVAANPGRHACIWQRAPCDANRKAGRQRPAFDYIEMFYSPKRWHSCANGQSSVGFEK